MMLRVYKRWLSPLLPAACRYYPTCSEYALGAIEEHGLRRGGPLAVRRLCRCHPFGGSGFDPVPPGAQPVGRKSSKGSSFSAHRAK